MTQVQYTDQHARHTRLITPVSHTTSDSHRHNPLQHREQIPLATRHARAITNALTPPVFSHPRQIPLITHLQITTSDIPLCVTIYCVLLSITILHVHVLFVVHYFVLLLWAVGLPQCVVQSLYGYIPRGPEHDPVESKHLALLSRYMFSITIVVFDRPSPHYIVQTPQV